MDTTTQSSHQSEPEHTSAFDEQNWWPVLLIMLSRLYDLELALLSAINPVKASEIVELHEQGHTFAPIPKFVSYEEPDEVSGLQE